MKEKILSVSIIGLMILAGFGIVNTEAAAWPSWEAPGDSLLDVAVAVNSEGEFEGEFDILIAAVSATPRVAKLLDARGQRTVFAPTDDAFAALADELGLTVDELVDFLLDNPRYLKNVLKYHIARGRLYAEDVLEKYWINTYLWGRCGFLRQDGGVLTDNLGRDANIIVTDVEASNGVIHVIDAVVLPYAAPGNSLLDVAIAVNSEGEYAGQFDILIAAVSATPSIANRLDSRRHYTVFAPTDDAFAALAEELGLTVDELVDFLLDNPRYLKHVLMYHITRGTLYADDVLNRHWIKTLFWGWYGFLRQDEGVLTDNLGRDANIIVTDVEAANGIIHVIDAVVLPYAP